MTTTPNFKEFNTIVADMAAELKSKNVGITDMNPGSVTRTLIEVVAKELDENYYMAEQIMKLFFALTTFGNYLDLRVAETPISPRNSGSKATGTIITSRSTAAPFAQLIPAGTTFETEDRTVQIITTADATMDLGSMSVNVLAQAAVVGASGNLNPGVVLKQVGVAVSLIETVVVDAVGFKGGLNIESDSSLLARYLDYVRNPGTSGNNAHYKQWAFEVAGVGGVKVIPRWNGIGTVKVVLLGLDKLPASAAVVQAVQTYIDPNQNGDGEGAAPSGATVTVVAATGVIINVSSTIDPDGTKELADIQTSYGSLLATYLGTIAFGKDTTVRYNQVDKMLLDVGGVIDYSNFLINGGTANIVIGADAVVVAGMVTFNE